MNMPNGNEDIFIEAYNIYTTIKNQPLRYLSSSNIKMPLSPMDKKCLALFLSILENSETGHLLKQKGVTPSKVINTFDLKEISSSNDNGYEQLNEEYSKEFESVITFLLSTISEKEIVDYDSSKEEFLYPEKIIIAITSSHCSSYPIFKYLYTVNNWLRPDEKIEDSSISIALISKVRQKLKAKIAKNNQQITLPKKSNSKGTQAQLNAIKFIEQYGENLTKKEYHYNPCTTRTKEIGQLITALFMSNTSPLLIGEPGVGKSILPEGLAYLIQQQRNPSDKSQTIQTLKIPNSLLNKQIIQINTASLTAETSLRGDVEKRMKELIAAVKTAGNCIIFIDELHTVIGAGTSDNSNLDIANLLKPHLNRGGIKIIGATTPQEYQEYILRDLAFARRFEEIKIEEPTHELTKIICKETIPQFSQEMMVGYNYTSDDTEFIIQEITTMCKRGNRAPDNIRNNPIISLSVLEKAFAKAAFKSHIVLEDEDILEAVEDCPYVVDRAKKLASQHLNIFFKSSNLGVNKVPQKVINFKLMTGKSPH